MRTESILIFILFLFCLFQSKRGSFLSRGDGVLAKLAKMTGSAKENVMAGAKSRGNFVFSAISPTKRETQPVEDIDAKVKFLHYPKRTIVFVFPILSLLFIYTIFFFFFQTSKRKAPAGLTNAEKRPCLVTAPRKSSGLFDHL